MKEPKAMSASELKVRNAVYDGWHMSGVYYARFDDHERSVRADSRGMLFSQLIGWYERHQENHPLAHMLVRCDTVC